MKRILSIDGGGLLGVIPAALLEYIEAQTGKLCRDIFSFTAGTSTGALITAAIAAGIPASKIVDIYLKRGKDIFSPQAPWNTMKRVAKGYMYESQNLFEVLNDELGSAKDWRIDDCPIDVLITAKRVSDGHYWYFVKNKLSNAGTTGRNKLVDCVMASAAAPTYFPPWNIYKIGDMVDGGIGIFGNPVYRAATEAFEYDSYKPEDTSILTLGTGQYPNISNPSGLMGWLEWTVSELLGSPEGEQTELVKKIYPKASLCRIDPAFDKIAAMDDPNAIAGLYSFTKAQAPLLMSGWLFQYKNM